MANIMKGKCKQPKFGKEWARRAFEVFLFWGQDSLAVALSSPPHRDSQGLRSAGDLPPICPGDQWRHWF